MTAPEVTWRTPVGDLRILIDAYRAAGLHSIDIPALERLCDAWTGGRHNEHARPDLMDEREPNPKWAAALRKARPL